MKFCTNCGRPLNEGEVCSCSKNTVSKTISKTISKIDTSSLRSFFESMKNRMGIGDPELNKDDAFEKGKQIIPDCVKPNEGEITVKQYNIATLRNRILGIPFVKAMGRIQVTNKRVIFRAPGRSLVGRTTLQQEFAIDELAGIEARREYVFAFWAMIFGWLMVSIGGGLSVTILSGMSSVAGIVIMSLLFGIAGSIPFFMLKKKWILKLLCHGFSFAPMYNYGLMIGGFWGGLLIFLGIISLLFTIFTIIIYAFRPNLVLLVKTKGATDAVDIKRRKKGGIFGRLFGKSDDEKNDHTGYTEILPADDVEKCFREINAMINDIQKLGDFGIEKWKA